MKKWISMLLAMVLALTLTACGGSQTPAEVPEAQPEIVETAPEQETQAEEAAEEPAEVPDTPDSEAETLPEDGTYTTKEDVALYIHLYGHLPDNFITKKEARALGWEGGSLEPYAPGMCIGGDYFGNYEGVLPTDDEYHECDIDTLGARNRGAKRLVYSDDAIYYTEDHYETFTLLYGEG